MQLVIFDQVVADHIQAVLHIDHKRHQVDHIGFVVVRIENSLVLVQPRTDPADRTVLIGSGDDVDQRVVSVHIAAALVHTAVVPEACWFVADPVACSVAAVLEACQADLAAALVVEEDAGAAAVEHLEAPVRIVVDRPPMVSTAVAAADVDHLPLERPKEQAA